MPRSHLVPLAAALAAAFALAACGARDDAAPADTAAAPVDVATPAAPTPAPAPAAPGPTSRHFALLDLDGNGSVTADEHARAAADMFRKMDSDADGIVTAVEMDAAQDALGGDARLPSIEKIRAIDRDQDDRLSAQEHLLGAQSLFGMMDTDGDGLLMPAEVEVGHAQAMGDGAPAPGGEEAPKP